MVSVEISKECPFCSRAGALLENGIAYARYDKYPVTPGHLLLIPVRHVADFFQTTREKRQALMELLFEAKALLDREYRPSGYNFGVNIGECAGQTIPHAHIHLIPRYVGDTKNPRGGVRGVIPERQSY